LDWPTLRLAPPSVSPTGHPFVSLTGHQSCRGRIQRIWKAHELKPHLVKTLKLSNDKRFVEKVRKRSAGPTPVLTLPRVDTGRGGIFPDPRQKAV
jgi:hypothetical protein